MVIIVPAFAKGYHANDCIVPTFIMGFEWLCAPYVADAIDAPRCVMLDHDSDDSAPQATC